VAAGTKILTPDPAQREVLDLPGLVVVRAGAGTGKTTLLAHEYLRLLEQGVHGRPLVPDQILAITFTERAAAEMTARIRELLEELLVAPETGPNRRERLRAARRQLLGSQISTIHGFCARILRENPLESRIDPRATILDEVETGTYLGRLVEERLTVWLREGDGAARALVRWLGFAGRGHGAGAVTELVRLLRQAATHGWDAAWLRERLAAQEGAVAAARTRLADDTAEVIRLTEGIVARREALGRWGRRLAERVADGWPRWRGFLRALGAADAGVDLTELESFRRLVKSDAAEVKEDVGRIRDLCRVRTEHAAPPGSIAANAGFLRALPLTRGLTGLFIRLLEHGAERRRADSVLTYDDLIAGARALVRDHPEVRARYARRFAAVLLDECQDTDRQQGELIEELVMAGGIGRCVVVGDEKQSIYGFRGADATVIGRFRERFGQERPLYINYRAQEPLVEFVNALGAALMPPLPGGPPAAPVWTETDELTANRRVETDGPHVRLLTCADRPAGSARDAREHEARALAEMISSLCVPHGPWTYKNIAVLLRALTDVKLYEHALRRADIPYYVVKGRGFYQTEEVRDLGNLLAAVDDADDGIALAAVLRSPLFGVDDASLLRLARGAGGRRRLGAAFRDPAAFADLAPEMAVRCTRARRLLGYLRERRRRWSIAELLEEALRATDFEAVLLGQFQGTQRVGNVRKLIEVARQLERRGVFDLGDFVRHVRRLLDEEPLEAEAQLLGEEDDVVQLMSVHQAKGLEWRVVIVPDLGRPRWSPHPPVVLSSAWGLIVHATVGAGDVRLPHRLLLDAAVADGARARGEEARLLYVACSRARDLLVLSDGSAEAGQLAGSRRGERLWCDDVWDLIGRDHVRAVAGSGTGRVVTITGPRGKPIEVHVEASGALLAADRPGAVPVFGAAVPGARAETQAAFAFVEASDAAARATAAARIGDGGRGEAEALVARVLEFTPPAPRSLVVSPTRLAAFARCARYYFLHHLVGIDERGGGEAGGERARLRGIVAHAVLERLDVAQATGDARAAVAALLTADAEARRLPPEDLAAIEDDLVAFLAGPEWQTLAGADEVVREAPFMLALRGDAAGPCLLVAGQVDVAARHGTTLRLRDYKYAAHEPARAADYRLQMEMYALALERATGLGDVRAGITFLRGGSHTVELELPAPGESEGRLVALGRALATRLSHTTAIDAWEKLPDRTRCDELRCGFRTRCWGREAPSPIRTAPGRARRGRARDAMRA
jgi:ATP-dependent helicase/nuclease subunit A